MVAVVAAAVAILADGGSRRSLFVAEEVVAAADFVRAGRIATSVVVRLAIGLNGMIGDLTISDTTSRRGNRKLRSVRQRGKSHWGRCWRQ